HLRAAAALQRLPELAQAYAGGQVGLAHVEAAAAVLPDLPASVLAAGAGKLLAEQATAHPPHVFARAAARIRDHVAPAAADRRARDAAILPAVLGTAGQILDLGRATRLVTPALRRALVLRDRGCRFPGCDRPPEWTDGHHIHPWATGGPTTLPNLILLCRHHHTLVHEGGWTIHLDTATNTVTATRPNARP